MPAPKGNQFWKARSSHGRKPIFNDSDQLWAACCEYFEWVEEHPIEEEKAFCYQGEVFKDMVYHIRAMTIQGLCFFLNIADDTWASYRIKEGFSAIVAEVEKVIYEQKFTGAAADQLNSNIIARDLGLKDTKEVSGPGGGPIQTQAITFTPVGPDD